MVTSRELSLAIYGIWRLARLDRSAVQFFDNTPEAFWRSFNAAVIAAPAYILLVLLDGTSNEIEAGFFRIAAVESISYVIGWVLFPLVMISFTDNAGCGRNYYRFIAAWNWSIVLQIFVFLGVTAFGASGALPGVAASFAGLIAVIAILFYQGFIAHVMLDIRGGPAALIVLIDLILGFGLNLMTHSFLR